MIHYYLLLFHSWFRWLVLLSLLFAIYRAFTGWLGGKQFSVFDDRTHHITATIAHLQLLLGIALYFISPLIRYFLANFSEAVHDREIRFFGMEHSLMMLLGIVILSIGSSLAKRKSHDAQKFKTIALWFTATLLIILSSVPWQFSPLVSRPFFRL